MSQSPDPKYEALAKANPEQVVTILYCNWRAVTEPRRIFPLDLQFKATTEHPQPQWILEAYCLERHALRSFAMSGIFAWARPLEATGLDVQPPKKEE